MSNITTAASQYANRPADERFGTVPAFLAACNADKAASMEADRALRDLRPVVVDGTVRLQGPKGNPAALTHWSFGQLARTVGAPAGYLRELPADLTAQCLQHGISTTPDGSDARLLVKRGTTGDLTIRALTSTSYGRLWDADVYGMVAQQIMGNDPQWQLPPTWKQDASGQPLREGAYRGDRDSFLIVCNGGSIVEDPSAMQSGPGSDRGGAMYRALMISNSEVGSRSLTIESVLYRYICGNHILWGATMDRRFRRRHVGQITRQAAAEIGRFAWQFSHASVARDEALIRGMIQHEVAQTDDAIVSQLRAWGATQEQAASALQQATQFERNPRSYWGIANGLTRASQETPYQDDRYALDKLAGEVLARAARLVTV